MPMFFERNLFPGLLALAAAFLILFLFMLIALYIYMSLAFSAIAKKAKYSSPAIAWIPVVGPLIITSSIAKMHWWPILFLVAIPIPFISMAAIIVVTVFSIIWLWKTYEKIRKPGWWALFNLLQPVGLILLGVAAWSKK